MRQRVRVRLRSPGARSRDPEPDPRAGDGNLEDFDPFEGDALAPDPALTAAERAEAEEEARHGVPPPDAEIPSPGEQRVESRFRAAMGRIAAAADRGFARLDEAWTAARADASRIEAGAAAERQRTEALGGALPACQRIEARYREAQAAKRELDGFRADRGIPEYRTPRPAGRGWIALLVGVALAETTANGLLLHSASTEGVVANWIFAALVTALNVGLLGWIIGDLVFRRMLHAGALRRTLLACSLLPCLVVAGLLHFGFAHYRDAVQALDAATTAAAVDIGDIDAGAGVDAAPDPHPPRSVSVEQAVFNELRAQFLPWRPGATFVDHPADLAPEDHSLDVSRSAPSGRVGYAAADGGLVLAEDPLAGRFEGWRSVLLLAIGFVALALSAWKWFDGREPIPHFARLHRRCEETRAALNREVEAALAETHRDERSHRRRLDAAEAEILALAGRLTRVHSLRLRTAAGEEDLLGRTAAAALGALGDYREANRRHRLSQDPPPPAWSRSPRLAPPARPSDMRRHWESERETALAEVADAAERMRFANAAHAPRAAAAWEEVRERIAQAARLPATRRSSTPPGPADPSGPPSGLVSRAEEGLGPRLEVAS